MIKKLSIAAIIAVLVLMAALPVTYAQTGAVLTIDDSDGGFVEIGLPFRRVPAGEITLRPGQQIRVRGNASIALTLPDGTTVTINGSAGEVNEIRLGSVSNGSTTNSIELISGDVVVEVPPGAAPLELELPNGLELNVAAGATVGVGFDATGDIDIDRIVGNAPVQILQDGVVIVSNVTGEVTVSGDGSGTVVDASGVGGATAP